MKAILTQVLSGQSLSRSEAARAMSLIMGQGSEPVSPEQVAALLGAIRSRKETVEELIGFASAMRAGTTQLPLKKWTSATLIDTCGTGGDGSNTFNISTASALVVAAAGVGVAKHGNRSVSSRCGSADVLEALGIRTDLSPTAVGGMMDATGFGFLFVPVFHPHLKNVGPIRRAIGVPTAFNLLGPLANPAKVKRQVMGVYDRQLLEPIAQVLAGLGVEEALVVHADLEGGARMDELSLAGPTQTVHLKGGKISKQEIKPSDAGLASAPMSALAGGDGRENAEIIEKIFSGEKGPRRDVVVFNAGAALWIAGKAADLKQGVALAAQAIDSGAARDKLAEIRRHPC